MSCHLRNGVADTAPVDVLYKTTLHVTALHCPRTLHWIALHCTCTLHWIALQDNTKYILDSRTLAYWYNTVLWNLMLWIILWQCILVDKYLISYFFCSLLAIDSFLYSKLELLIFPDYWICYLCHMSSNYIDRSLILHPGNPPGSLVCRPAEKSKVILLHRVLIDS